MLFGIFLERIVSDGLDDYQGAVNIGGRNITELRQRASQVLNKLRLAATFSRTESELAM